MIADVNVVVHNLRFKFTHDTVFAVELSKGNFQPKDANAQQPTVDLAM